MHRRAHRSVDCTLLALLALAACDQHDPDAASPTSPIFQQALTVTASPSSIPADGFSRTEILAQISLDADERTVRFKTNLGTFVGATEDDGRQLDVEADSAGQARVQLKSAIEVGTALVEASVIDTANDDAALIVKTLTVEFAPVDPSTVIQIGTDPTAGEADGFSGIFVFADVASQLATEEVTFTATLATFDGSDKARPDANHRATVVLKSPDKVGTALLTATVGSFSDQTTIFFDTAFPHFITVSTTSRTVSASGSIEVTASFFRDSGRGTVTVDLPATFSATSGTFRNETVVSGAPRQATADFVPGDLTDGTAVTITVGVLGSGVTGTTTLTVTNP